MKIKINYFDNIIELSPDNIFAIEIENKTVFYRIVCNLISISEGNKEEDIQFIENDNKEVESPKIKVFTNYFTFDFDSKKQSNDLMKYVLKQFTDEDVSNINMLQRNVYKKITRLLNKLELSIEIDEDDLSFENFLKKLKFKNPKKDTLLDNLLLLLDIEKELASSYILFFINLKQFLTQAEIKEFYKYAIYNNLQVVLIDSQAYGITKTFEQKLIIDENLDEFMI